VALRDFSRHPSATLALRQKENYRVQILVVGIFA
jgi:hypothetical protein